MPPKMPTVCKVEELRLWAIAAGYAPGCGGITIHNNIAIGSSRKPLNAFRNAAPSAPSTTR